MCKIKILLILFVLLGVNSLYAEDMTREEQLKALTVNHHRAAAGHSSYEVPDFYDTPAPRGFKPVYISHYGRHGSRYQGSREPFHKVLPLLDSLSKYRLLTPDGEMLRYELHLIDEAHDDMEALLTQKGSSEQRGVAERLYKRVPKLFKQKESRVVSASATSVVRCLQSMTNFVTAIKGCSPDVEVIYNTGLDKTLHYLAPRVSKKDKEMARALFVPVQDSLLAVVNAVGTVSKRLFADVDKVEMTLKSSRSLDRFVLELFEAAQGAGCLDINVDPLRLFTTEELYDFLEIRNLYFCGNYGPLAPTIEFRAKTARPLLRGMVKEADAALAGNGRCADLRFGHDSGLGPLLVLVGIEGFDKGIDPRNSLAQWPAWKYLPMCSNLQIIFYRNRKGEVLVKFLRNETETTIPCLDTVNGVYHKWQDVRKYFLKRTGDYNDLPEYYEDYLGSKADEIAELKESEADGFFYWTDAHFPDNAGNTAAILEYIQNRVGPIKLFFGGDAALNADALEGGVSANSSSLLQAGMFGNLFPVRGNHDFTSSTAKTAVFPETMGNLGVNRYLSSFCSPIAVTDVSSAHPTYYYVDSPKGKIRYLVLDSTDSVSDSRVRYGMSEYQQRWVMNKVVSTLPKGWGLIVFSHVPLAPDHTDQISLLHAGDALAATDRVMMFICGHRHSDMESGIKNVFQVLTAADCLVDMGRTVSPYSSSYMPKEEGTTNEHTLDYISVSSDHKKITMKRLGWGSDRIFNIKPIEVVAGKELVFTPSLSKQVKSWYAFDAQGNKVGKYINGLRDYITSNQNASISNDGRLSCIKAGYTIVVALYEDGTKEYFMIKIIN